jgi:hypothetical protein
MKNFIKQFVERKLIGQKENVSYTQIVGCLLILFGIIVMIGSGVVANTPSSSSISISFFITMLGFAFAFPSLLEGNDGLSTMRIVVFMMTNVICMLLIRIGWDKYSLTCIGLDQWWMGVIAFVFGAKATQSYFENMNKMPAGNAKAGMAAVPFSNADVAKLAVAQNEQFLKSKFPNIVSVSDAVHDLNSTDSHVIALYLKDNNTVGIPDRLEVKMADGSTKTIATEIIKGVGACTIQLGQGDSVAGVNDPLYKGSVCCAVKSLNNNNFLGIVTAAHIYTHGDYNDANNTVLNPSMQTDVLFNGQVEGNWYYKQLTDNQDLIIIKMNDGVQPNNLKQFNNRYHTVSDADIKNDKAKVTILSVNNKRTEAFILDYNIGYPVKYCNGSFYKRDIILIGDRPDRNNSMPVAQSSDSGSCVFLTDTNEMVGILLGSNEHFTFVLPIQSTLSSNFQII